MFNTAKLNSTVFNGVIVHTTIIFFDTLNLYSPRTSTISLSSGKMIISLNSDRTGTIILHSIL